MAGTESVAALAGRTILLVEDDPIVSLDMVDFLESTGAAVTGPVETVAEAVQAIAAGVFDVALVDAHLADGAALEILDALDRRGIPYIVVTGDENFGLQYSPDAPCVPKPLDKARLRRLLSGLLAPADA